MKIGTHNSCTGEMGKGLLSWLVTPFAKCQSKNLKEQYEFGCRYFDIRVKRENGKWKVKHGLWTCKLSADEVFEKLADLTAYYNEEVYVMVTYEGKIKTDEAERGFLTAVYDWMMISKKVKVVWICIKSPWRSVIKDKDAPDTESKFMLLNGSSWHTLIPIPWLWNKIYYNNISFGDEAYTLIDFL